MVESGRLPRTPLDTDYRGKRILVTGHTGFKGSWLCLWLQEMGAQVFGYSLPPPTTPNLFDIIRLGTRMVHRIGDVRDTEAVQAALDEIRPEVIFHLAAQTIVRQSYESPLETLETNVMGTAHVLESIRRSGRPCAIVAVTSDKCYENRGGVSEYIETDCLGGHDPYSASKGAAEIVISAYRHAYFPVEDFRKHGVALASVRAGNVIGGGDWAKDRIVPDIMRALYQGEPVLVRNPSAVRPWQHVLDALSGYLWLAAQMIRKGSEGFAEAWNFGPVDEEVITVRELVEHVLRSWDGGTWQAREDRGAPPEARHLRLCSHKAVQRLGWRPAYRLEDTVEATAAWYKAGRDRNDMVPFTVGQIGQYILRAQAGDLIWAGRTNQAMKAAEP